MFPSHNLAAGHPLTGWHGAGDVGFRATLKTAVFTYSDADSCRNVTAHSPNCCSSTPNCSDASIAR